MPRKITVTAALPYANGSIHLGHLVEYIQTDIFVRFQKMMGNECLYFCADDTHGAPIMIRAKAEGCAPEKIIEKYHAEHLADFHDFHISFDNYHSTNSTENRELAEMVYLKLKDGGHITSRDVEQAYCETDSMFLPDRFVRGICPKCSAPDQYGDSCDVCGAHYASTELKEPKCSVCGSPPTRKVSRHLFFRVSDFIPELEKFMAGDALQPEVKNFLATWMKEGLKEWDISRDGPYFGFKIPGEENKYFYVWLDAPIGYLASAKNWADKNGRKLEEVWGGEGGEVHHFIGKDIVYFHTLFWIPMLTGAGIKIPDRIHVHGFLTINGEKMSKSRGTFINARDFSANINTELLRYYYASKLKNSVDDLDINFQDFVFRVNAELVNKVANLGSRTISILNKTPELENKIIISSVTSPRIKEFLDEFKDEGKLIAQDYEACDFALAIKKIMRLADKANQYIDEKKPWDLKNNPEELRIVLTIGIMAFRMLTIYLKPVVPAFAEKVERILNEPIPFNWESLEGRFSERAIGQFERLMDRVDMKAVEKVMESAKQKGETAVKIPAPTHSHLTKHGEDVATPTSAPGGLIEYDDFAKIQLRTAKVLTAERVAKADKLLKLSIDVGGEVRTLVAGIAKSYTAEEMVGKTIVIVANLKPRKLMGVESNGMLLAVNDGERLTLIGPAGEVGSGLKVS
jgi:methionyl-tRNA synthetase